MSLVLAATEFLYSRPIEFCDFALHLVQLTLHLRHSVHHGGGDDRRDEDSSSRDGSAVVIQAAVIVVAEAETTQTEADLLLLQ